MGTLAHATAVLGLLAGVIVAKLAKPELKQGQKYFTFLHHFLLTALIAVGVWQKVHGLKLNLDVLIFLYFIPLGTLLHNKYKILIGIAVLYLIGVTTLAIF